MRCFLALPVDIETEEALSTLQDELQVGRLVDAQGFHITLAFLDEQDDDTLARLHEELCLLDLSSVAPQIVGLQVDSAATPHLLWASLAETTDLRRIQRAVAGAVESVDITLPRRRFRPHITLSRFGRRLPEEAHAKIARFLGRFAAFQHDLGPIDRLVLYRSDLTPDGAIYTELADYALQSRPDEGVLT